jgi:hypothetical protein
MDGQPVTRFDLRYDGDGPATLLENNADTPTSLLQAAGPQWFWLEELYPDADQWNSLHERLVEAWRRQRALLPPGPVHLAYTLTDEPGRVVVDGEPAGRPGLSRQRRGRARPVAGCRGSGRSSTTRFITMVEVSRCTPGSVASRSSRRAAYAARSAVATRSR